MNKAVKVLPPEASPASASPPTVATSSRLSRSSSRVGMSSRRLILSPRSSKHVRKSGVSDDFKRQTAEIAKQLRLRDRDRVFAIDPRESPILSVWDCITTTALAYTAVLTPFEVGFLPASVTVDTWFVLNRFLDVIFILDMVLQFFVVYQSVNETVGGDSKWVTERQKIVRHYLFGWFPLDLLSIIPSTFDFVPFVISRAESEGDVELAEKLSGLRAIRALRLVKLVRLIRASRLFNRWKARVGASSATIAFVKIVSGILFVSHWYACVLALQAQLHDDPAVTWLGLQGHCADEPLGARALLDNMTSAQVFAEQCPTLETHTFFLAAFSWSIMILTGCGEVGYYPSQDNAETLIVTILVVGGALMWAKVLATFCDLATNSDPAAVEYRQALDDLNRFCREHGLPSELKRRLRQYFHQRKHVMLAKSTQHVCHMMSTSLQVEVVMLVHNHWLERIWFLRGAEPACLVQLALRMEPFVFAPGELPEAIHLYVIHRGIVMHGLRVLTSGRMWGEEEVLLDHNQRSVSIAARCMTYVEVYSVSHAAFNKVTNSFPEAKRLVRRRAVLVLARRGFLRLIKRLRRQQAAGDPRDFLQMVLDAAGAASAAGTSKVVSTETGGAAYLALQDDITTTKAAVDGLRAEMHAQMSALRDGLNALLTGQQLPTVPPPKPPPMTAHASEADAATGADTALV